jgi:hypothetical protein
MSVPGPSVTGERMTSARQRSAERNELIVSYMLLRKVVGWIGSLLPIALIAGNAILGGPRPYSMSAYYYTPMRNIFVGALCALGVFLLAYDGYDEVDRWVTNVAGFCAIGVAFCPTKPPVCPAAVAGCPPHSVRQVSAGQQIVGDVHLFFAFVTFVALGVMALRFAKSMPTPGGQILAARVRHGLGLARPREETRSARKKRRNVIYRVCGFAIFICVVLAVVSNLLPAPVKAQLPLLFVFEALAVFAFGLSWFVKGQTLLPIIKDHPGAPRSLPTPPGPQPGPQETTLPAT